MTTKRDCRWKVFSRRPRTRRPVEAARAHPQFRGAVEPLEDRRLLAGTIQLIAFYDFEGDVEDSTGNSLHGTVYGSGTSFGPGYNGQGIVFDGNNNDAVTVPINISPDMTPAVTIGAWVNVTGLNNLGDGIHTIVQSDGDYARKILISDQSAAADATPGTTYYTAFTGRDFNNNYPSTNPNQFAPPVKPVVPGNDGWVFLAASYNGYNHSVQILADDQSFLEPLAYPNQAGGFSYLNIGGLRIASGQIYEEFIGAIDNVFIINGAASLTQLESIRDAADPFAQARAVAAEMAAAGPTRTFAIDFSDAGGQGRAAVLATGIVGTDTWNDFQENGNRLVGPVQLSDTEGNLTSVSVDFSTVTGITNGYNNAGNPHAQAGQDGFYRARVFGDVHPDATFRFRGLDPSATYRLTGIGSWNFNEWAEIKVDADGDGTLDAAEFVRPYSGAIHSIGAGGSTDVVITPAADGTLLAAFGDAFDNGNTESIAGLILEEFGTGPAAGITVDPVAGLQTTEGGGADTFSVVLDSIPAGNVTIRLRSSNENEGTVSPASLTFTPANALTPQVVTVTGQDEDLDDGDTAYTILTDPAESIDPDYAGVDPDDVTVTNVDDDPQPLQVTLLEPTASGFVVDFNRAIDPDVLNLYDIESGVLGPADVTLTGSASGPVTGSLVVVDRRLTFVATGGLLPADNYTVTLRSADDAIRDLNGERLDGDEDGWPGVDYVAPLTVTAPEDVVVSLPDFTRGPGQSVDIPANGPPRLPLVLADSRTAGNGITSVRLTITYDPQLLNITSAVLGDNAPAGADVSVNTGTPGQASVSFTSTTTPLARGAQHFASLIAGVPGNATYGAAQVLDVSGVSVNDGAVSATADDALHAVAYLGDATGDGTYSGLDAQRVARIAVDLDGGLENYPAIDPVIVADVTGDGSLSGLDAQRIAQEAVGLDPVEIPQRLQAVRLADPGSRSRQVSDGAIAPSAKNPNSTAFGYAELAPVVEAAVVRIESVGYLEDDVFQTVALEIVDLSGGLLGRTLGHVLGGHPKDEDVMNEWLPLGIRRIWHEWFLDDEAGCDPELGELGLTPTEVDDYFAMT